MIAHRSGLGALALCVTKAEPRREVRPLLQGQLKLSFCKLIRGIQLQVAAGRAAKIGTGSKDRCFDAM